MNKRRLGRGLEALLGREEGGFEPDSLEELGTDPRRRRSDRSQPVSSPAAISRRPRLPRWPIRSASTACFSRSWFGRRHAVSAHRRRARLRASIEAQLHEIPARVMDLDDQRVFELAMVENLQREDPQRGRQGHGVSRLSGPLRWHPGRACKPAGTGPLHHLEPDSPAGAARRGSGSRPRR